MADVNTVTLTGKVVRDAEISQKSNGVTICEFALANNYNRKTGENWTKEANFFNIAIFGNTATALYPFLKKGQLIGIEAELRQNRWEQDGMKRTSNEIIVKEVHLLSSSVKKQNESTTETEQCETSEHEETKDYPIDEEEFPEDIF